MFGFKLDCRYLFCCTRVRCSALPFIALLFFTSLYSLSGWAGSLPQTGTPGAPLDLCPRPQAGSAVPEPEDLRSQNGVLKLDLSIHNYRQQDGSTRYCYLLPDGTQSPTLRLHPGDLLILRLKNDLVPDKSATLDLQALGKQTVCSVKPKKQINACTSGAMTTISTNLHFHGLTVPPVCHQDDVLKTAIQPSDSAFEYRFKIPRNEPPGLYWYHPHIHGFSSKQVQGGASGALIIEGIERAIPDVAGLPERVLIIRDQDLLYPDAAPSKSEPVVPKMLMDRDGDAGNNGTGFGKPAKDLSINFVPVPYPEYPPASITMKPDERQLWRVLNASSITYLNLSLLFQHSPQQLGIIAIDGVPIKTDREHTTAIEWVNHIGLPPGARVEFIMNGPPVGVPGLFVTRTVDTGPSGENDTNRALATVLAKEEAATLQSTLPTSHDPLPPSAVAWLGDVTPTRVRKLYFSEKQADPSDPNSATEFYITEDGKTPTLFDPQAGMPNIVTTQGDVEDWIIENRSTELHAFHIHQIHFLVMDWSGIPIDEPFLRDTVNIPYFKDNMLTYPSVRLRMDFRDPNTIGTFVYHCHLLEHEDGGMMGTVRVERPTKKL